MEYIKVINKSVQLNVDTSLDISEFSEKGWYLLNLQCNGWGTLNSQSCVSMPVYSDSKQLSGCISIWYILDSYLSCTSIRIYNNKIRYSQGSHISTTA